MIHYDEVSINSLRGCLDPPLYARLDAPGMARRPRETPLRVTPVVVWPPAERGEQLVKPTTPVKACVGFLVSRGAKDAGSASHIDRAMLGVVRPRGLSWPRRS